MKNLLEKIKANSKVVAIVAAILVVIIILAIVMANVLGGSYKNTLKKFEKAMESEENMEKFVDKNVNLRAIYAVSELKDVEDEDEFAEKFKEEYKKAKKADYTSDETKESAYDFYKTFAEEDIKMSDVGKIKKTDKLDLYGTEIEIKGLKVCSIKLEAEGTKMSADAYFYKGKLFVIIPDFSSIEY